jgi:hypothetical protein
MFRFNEVELEAIANADAHLNNVALPTYSQMMDHLVYLAQQAELSNLSHDNLALKKARALLQKFFD